MHTLRFAWLARLPPINSDDSCFKFNPDGGPAFSLQPPFHDSTFDSFPLLFTSIRVRTRSYQPDDTLDFYAEFDALIFLRPSDTEFFPNFDGILVYDHFKSSLEALLQGRTLF